MRQWRKIVAVALALVVGLPVLLVAFIDFEAWYHRRQAAGLLAVVRQVQPGVTTEADFLKAVEPFDNHVLQIGGENGPPSRHVPGSLGIDNWPSVPIAIIQPLYEPLSFLAEHRIIPYDIDFIVIADFKGGVVSSLMVEEMQGGGHPYNGHVRMTAQRFERDDPHFDPSFTGYSVSQMHREDGTLWESFVDLDERATTIERQRALDFDFQCFTYRGACRDGAKMLRPVPNRTTNTAAP